VRTLPQEHALSVRCLVDDLAVWCCIHHTTQPVEPWCWHLHQLDASAGWEEEGEGEGEVGDGVCLPWSAARLYHVAAAS
jgi:hypothetical protein